MNKLKDDLIFLEKHYKKNSVEVYYEDKKELFKWKELIDRYIWANLSLEDINTFKDVTYYTIPRSVLMDNLIISYLDKIKEKLKTDKNTVVVLTNEVYNYEIILEKLNEKKILTLLYTNNIEDLDLSYTNLIVRYSDNPRKEALKHKLKIL